MDSIRERYDILVGQMRADEDGQDQEIASLEDIFAGDENVTATSFATWEENVKAYAGRLGTTLASSQTGHVLFNGRHFDFDEVNEMYVFQFHRHSSSSSIFDLGYYEARPK